jgi:Ca2+-binding EF-hand superfamily protein
MPKLVLLAAALFTFAAPALAQQPRNNTGGVMRYDTNKDGAVDRDEWNAGQEARFKRLDTNGDGKLSQDELFARTPAAGNSVLPSDRQANRQSSYFQRLDTDKDGVVTLMEFIAQGERNFVRCDLDKNGRIDTAECRQALQRK